MGKSRSVSVYAAVFLMLTGCDSEPVTEDLGTVEQGVNGEGGVDLPVVDRGVIDAVRKDAPGDVTTDSPSPDHALPDHALPDAALAGHFRKALPIKAGANAGKGYQLRVRVGQSAKAAGAHVHLGGRGRPGFQDVRFVAGGVKLPHWLESISGAAPNRTATFWVKVAADLNYAQTIHLHYGVPAAPSASNAGATFELHDGFETPFSLGKTAMANPKTYLKTPTYDGSGQAIHPDIVHFPKGWSGYTHWMAMTPYPGGKDPWENPSLLASNDGVTWVAPVGLPAPLYGKPPCDHNSDTDLVYNPDTDELWIYWLDTRRASRCAGHKGKPYYNHNWVMLVRVGRAGGKWSVSKPTVTLDQDLGKESLELSPSVVRRGKGQWYLWTTNGSTKVYRYKSSDGKVWTGKQQVNITRNVWHLNVSHVAAKKQYWMLSDYPSAGGALHWSTSTDGLKWTTHTTAVLSSRPGAWDANLYRGCFLYDDATDLLRLWYSAYTTGPTVWHTGLAQGSYAGFLASLSGGPTVGWNVFWNGGTWASSLLQSRRGQASGQLVQSSSTSMVVFRPLPASNAFVLEWDLYDDMDSTAFKMVRVATKMLGGQTGLGVWTGASKTHYAFHNNSYKYTVTSAPRTKGWHKLGMKVEAKQTTYYVEGKKVGSLTGLAWPPKAVTVEGYHGGHTTFYVDDLRVRHAAGKEPVPGAPGAEQKGTWGVY